MSGFIFRNRKRAHRAWVEPITYPGYVSGYLSHARTEIMDVISYEATLCITVGCAIWLKNYWTNLLIHPMSISGLKNIVTLTAGDRGNLAKNNYIFYSLFSRIHLKETRVQLLPTYILYEKMSIYYFCALIR
jgi:hypothetical protein